MDESTVQSNAVPTVETIGSLLSDPNLIRQVASILGTTKATGATAASSAGSNEPLSPLSDPELLKKLPQVLSLLKPLLSAPPTVEATVEATAVADSAEPSEHIETAATPPSSIPKPNSHDACRDDLLLALKPFLSPERREAVDTILRIARLGNILKQLR